MNTYFIEVKFYLKIRFKEYWQNEAKEYSCILRSRLSEFLSINNFFLTNKGGHSKSLTFIHDNISSTNLSYRILFEVKIPSEHKLERQLAFIDMTHMGKETFGTNFSLRFA